jgi:hypothetical protein
MDGIIIIIITTTQTKGGCTEPWNSQDPTEAALLCLLETGMGTVGKDGERGSHIAAYILCRDTV